MAKIYDIRLKSNRFVQNLNAYLGQVVDDNETALLDLNRQQLLRSRLSNDGAILPKYSPAYARRKGTSNPNLFLTGDFQGAMVIQVNENQRRFQISSTDFKLPYLLSMYGTAIFGIAPSSRSKAVRLTTFTLGKLYRNKVFR